MKQSWWQGARGEWYLAVQILIFLLIAFGPQSLPGLPSWQVETLSISYIVGIGIWLIGLFLAFGGLFNLGRNLSPLPYPKEDAFLVRHGVYGIVRHPIYSGLILLTFGWGLSRGSTAMLLYSLLLFIFFEIKSRREEGWLREKYAGYRSYSERVKKLIPYIY